MLTSLYSSYKCVDDGLLSRHGKLYAINYYYLRNFPKLEGIPSNQMLRDNLLAQYLAGVAECLQPGARATQQK